ncbi:MAG TPA: copper amine oxidase N-terminal domain-containing protein [Syntrophomonas sp.]|nr:copper amine oxidase N-terminal domain-containing protein [Syntrophomonas sp.]
MKKKFAVLLCLAMFMTIFAAPALAADPTVSVVIDGQAVTFADQAPIIDNSRTLVPLRAIFEAMGATVSWDDATKTATGVKGDITVVVAIGSVSPTINGVVKTIDVPAKIVNSRTLAPLRFVCEAFGGTVSWDGATYTASVVSAGGAAPAPAPEPAPAPAPAAATALSSASGTISKSAPADVPITITWGSATKVSKMLAGSPAFGLTYDPHEGVDYTVADNGDGTGVFVIKKELSNQLPVPLNMVPTGAEMAITIQFDNGTNLDYSLKVVD